VHETGWGEFDVGIKIYFVDSSGEKPINFFHGLKLHAYKFDSNGKPYSTGEPVNYTLYDEIVNENKLVRRLTPHCYLRCSTNRPRCFITYLQPTQAPNSRTSPWIRIVLIVSLLSV
jgi:hypothetical protein